MTVYAVCPSGGRLPVEDFIEKLVIGLRRSRNSVPLFRLRQPLWRARPTAWSSRRHTKRESAVALPVRCDRWENREIRHPPPLTSPGDVENDDHSGTVIY
jgi:hypothetical protein